MSGARGVCNALLQSIRVGPLAVINFSVGIKVDNSGWPLWLDVDAMVAPFFAPPVKLHEKLIVWKQEAVIGSAGAGWQVSFVYAVLHVPNVS